MEPSPFNPKWYSHKFHGPGIRYEIGICIRTGHVVWAYGSLPCGEWPDLRLARSRFILNLQAGEKAIADRGYNDQKKKETLNGRLKQFCCLKERFRHELYLNPLYFYVVVNLTQMMIEHGEPLYSVDF